MATSFSPALAPPLHVEIAQDILAAFRARSPIDREYLRALCAARTGRSDASGAWSMRQAYDALELAQALFLVDPDCPLVAADAAETLARLAAFAADLPVQSYRSESQVALQQFSTPIALSHLVARAAQPSADDLVLEPSAGNGLLAWGAARAGARLLLNELDPARRGSLAEAFPDAQVFAHDAELIDDLLSPALRPSLVLMNPPFARSDGRGEDRYAGGRHLLAALARLAPGGRLVAIMPESFSASGSSRALRGRAEQQASLRLDARIAGGAFARHGTGVAVRLVVFDKFRRDGRTPDCPIVETLAALLELVEALPARSAAQAPLRPRRAPLSLFRRTGPEPARPVPRLVAAATEGGVPLAYRVLGGPAPLDDQVGIYLPYRPSRIVIAGAAPHPTPLVESLAMGSVPAPRPMRARRSRATCPDASSAWTRAVILPPPMRTAAPFIARAIFSATALARARGARSPASSSISGCAATGGTSGSARTKPCSRMPGGTGRRSAASRSTSSLCRNGNWASRW